MNIKQKKLSTKAALTIPKDLRAEAGFIGGMAVDLIPKEDGILVRKHLPTCRFCGFVQEVKTVKGMEVCSTCANEIKQEVTDKYAG